MYEIICMLNVISFNLAVFLALTWEHVTEKYDGLDTSDQVHVL